jgi:hypothetical protein
MYLIIERHSFDNLSKETRFVFAVKAYDESYHNVKKKKEAFELINVKDNVDYQISSYVEKTNTNKGSII